MLIPIWLTKHKELRYYRASNIWEALLMANREDIEI